MLPLDEERTTLLTPQLRRTAVLTAITVFLMVSIILGVDLLFLATFSLSFLFLLAYLFSRWTLRSLKLKVVSSPEVMEGQTSMLRFQLINEGLIPRYLVELRIRLPVGVEPLEHPHLIFGQLMPRQIAEGTLQVRFRRRGLHPVGKGQLWAQDPLGLFVATRQVSLDAEVLVYPRPKPIPLIAEGAGVMLSWDETPTTFSLPLSWGDEFWGVRQYQPGDELRRIHWKVTAHRNELSVVATLPYLEHGAFLLLDRHPVSHQEVGEETTLDELVRIAAFLVRQWVMRGLRVVFWAPPTPPVTVEREWHSVWRTLALLELEPFALSDLKAIGRGVILTTSFSPLLSVFTKASTFGWKVWTLSR